jgi:hypothetical protein
MSWTDNDMGSAIINTMKIDSAVLIQLSKLYKSGVSVKNIAKQLRWDQQTTIRVLQLLGFNIGF